VRHLLSFAVTAWIDVFRGFCLAWPAFRRRVSGLEERQTDRTATPDRNRCGEPGGASERSLRRSLP